MAIEALELGKIEARGRASDLRQIEGRHHLLGREDFLVAVAPAQPHKIITQGRRQISHGPVRIDPERAVALGQFRPVRSMNERNVRHHRNGPAERVVDLGLTRGIGEVVIAADDMRHAHVVVVDDDGEHISRSAIRTKQDEIIEVLVLPNHAPLHLVLDHCLASQRSLEPEHRLDPGRGFGWVAIAPTAVIELGTALAARLLAHLHEFLWRGVAKIGTARVKQRASDLAVALGVRKLVDGGAIPIEPEPGEPVEDRVDRGLGGSFSVGVLDPQQHFSAAPAGVEPVEQRGARAPDMQEAGGRGSKACDDGLAHGA